jgi:hypothetical protein
MEKATTVHPLFDTARALLDNEARCKMSTPV